MPQDCRLYLITPPSIPEPAAFLGQLEMALSGGDVAALQIRLKEVADEAIAEISRGIVPLAQSAGVAVIMNDRPDLAVRLGCDGVHVGQQDTPYAEARRIVGPDRTVGVTCHDSLHLAIEAAEAGADYVAFGAFFPTSTKEALFRPDPELLAGWQQGMHTPCVAIGGITAANARSLAAAGADFLAVCAGVWSAEAGPSAAVAALNAEIAKGLQDRSADGTGLPARR